MCPAKYPTNSVRVAEPLSCAVQSLPRIHRRSSSDNGPSVFEFIKASGCNENATSDIRVTVCIPINVSQEVEKQIGRLEPVRQATNAAHNLPVVDPLLELVELASLQSCHHFIAKDRQGLGIASQLIADALTRKGELSLEVYTKVKQAVLF